jgi:hypothetical protein
LFLGLLAVLVLVGMPVVGVLYYAQTAAVDGSSGTTHAHQDSAMWLDFAFDATTAALLPNASGLLWLPVWPRRSLAMALDNCDRSID